MAEKNKNKRNTQPQTDDIIGTDEFTEEVAEYLDEVSSGEILSADKTDEEIRGKNKGEFP